MQHFPKKAVSHARLPIFDQIFSLQNRNLFWQGPKHHQPEAAAIFLVTSGIFGLIGFRRKVKK